MAHTLVTLLRDRAIAGEPGIDFGMRLLYRNPQSRDVTHPIAQGFDVFKLYGVHSRA